MIQKAMGLLASVVVLMCTCVPAFAQDVLYTERHEFTVKGPPYALEEKATIKVHYLSPRSTSWTEFGVWEQYFGPVTNLRAEHNGKRLRGDAFSEFVPESEDVFLSDGTLNQITLPEAPSVLDEVEYSYERSYLSPAYAPVLRIPNIDRLAEYSIVVKHPAGVSVDFKVFEPRGESAHTITRGDRQSSIVFRDLEPLDDLPLFAHNGSHASVLMDIRSETQALTPTGADEFAGWYSALVNQPPPAPTILPIAQGLRGATDSATVASMHDYVRESIRYIADERSAGAFVPRAPDLVVERKYGDCKDRAFLVAALAQSLGMRVDPVLITTTPRPEFEEVQIGLFNHVICAFTDEAGQTTYFDPTDPYSSFGDLPESDIDGHALRMGQDGAERLFVSAQSSEPTLELEIEVDLDAPESANAQVTIRGGLLGMVRGLEARRTEQDARNALSSVAGSLLYKIRLGALAPVEEGPRHRTYTARADLSQFVVASPTKRYLPLTPFRAIEAEAAERREDGLAVYTGDRPNVRLALEVAGPGWRPDETDRTLGDPDGPVWFSASASPTDAGSRVEYRFGQRTRRFTGDDRDRFLTLAGEYLGARRDVIIFRQPGE